MWASELTQGLKGKAAEQRIRQAEAGTKLAK